MKFVVQIDKWHLSYSFGARSDVFWSFKMHHLHNTNTKITKLNYHHQSKQQVWSTGNGQTKQKAIHVESNLSMMISNMELVTTRDLWFFQTNSSPITTLWWTFIYAISSIQFSLFAIDCMNFGKQNNYFPKLTNPISHFQKITEQLHNLFLQVHENDGWDEWYFKANFYESIDKKLTKTSQIIHVCINNTYTY